jgi:hypothetical protein
MVTPGDREFAGSAVDYRASFGSPELSALTTTLGLLVAASDGVGEAVTRHDRLALERCNEQAEALLDQVNSLTCALSDEDRGLFGEFGVTALCERLVAGSRRNAFLIEHAWATDAALMRLIMGLGTGGTDGAVPGYGTTPGPTCVDREA